MFDLIKQLADVYGPSGHEQQVAAAIEARQMPMADT